jgi:hypothetical protein
MKQQQELRLLAMWALLAKLLGKSMVHPLMGACIHDLKLMSVWEFVVQLVRKSLVHSCMPILLFVSTKQYETTARILLLAVVWDFVAHLVGKSSMVHPHYSW